MGHVGRAATCLRVAQPAISRQIISLETQLGTPIFQRLPKKLILPHPGMAVRRFVLEPVAEIAPRWKHGGTHRTAAELLNRL